MIRVFIGCILFYTISAFAQMKAEDIFLHARKAVVSIRSENMQASGFFIRENLVVTSFHVLRDQSSLVCHTSDNSFEVLGWVAVDSARDLAVLQIEGIYPHHLNLEIALPAIGSKVYTLGSTLGIEGTFSDGIVSNTRYGDQELEWIQYTAPTSVGNSGGPLLNERGEVIGVVSRGVWLVGQNVNLASPVSSLRALLEVLEASPRPLSEFKFAAEDFEAVPETLGFESYRFAEFRVDLPSEWEIRDFKGENGMLFAAYSREESAEDLYRENISLVRGNGKFSTAKLGLLAWIAQARKNATEFELIRMSPEADVPYFTYKALLQGIVPYYGLVYLYNVSPDNFVVELAWESPEKFLELRAVYEKIVHSVQVEK